MLNLTSLFALAHVAYDLRYVSVGVTGFTPAS